MYCFGQHDCLCLERCMQLACCTLWQTKAELWIYFWTVVKNSFSKQCPPLEWHYHRDVTHLRSKAFSIFSVRMDSVLPDELFRIFKTQETGKKNWLICSCASRQIDQPVVVPQWGYLYIRGKISGLCSCGLTLHVLHSFLQICCGLVWPLQQTFKTRAETWSWLWTFSFGFHTQTGQSSTQHVIPRVCLPLFGQRSVGCDMSCQCQICPW